MFCGHVFSAETYLARAAAQVGPGEKNTAVFRLRVDCKWKAGKSGEIVNDRGVLPAPPVNTLQVGIWAVIILATRPERSK